MNRYESLKRIFNGHSKSFFSRILSVKNPLVRNCTARRALLYIPGDDQNKLSQALKYKLDCIVMDCGDSVTAQKKEIARQTIKKFLDTGPVTKSSPEWIVRINSVLNRELCEADLDVFMSANNLPAAICLSKINHVDHLQWFSEKIWNLMIKRSQEDRGPIKLIMVVDSAIAVMNLPELCKKAMDLSTMAPIIPVALIFESHDFLTSVGGARTTAGIEVLYARQKTVLVAKAFGLQAIDMVQLHHKDTLQLKRECKEGVKMGFTGKQVIHPDQVAITQEIFAPSRSKIKWAKSVTQAFNESQKMSDNGNLKVEDPTNDMATFRLAQSIIETAKAAGKPIESKSALIE